MVTLLFRSPGAFYEKRTKHWFYGDSIKRPSIKCLCHAWTNLLGPNLLGFLTARRLKKSVFGDWSKNVCWNDLILWLRRPAWPTLIFAQLSKGCSNALSGNHIYVTFRSQLFTSITSALQYLTFWLVALYLQLSNRVPFAKSLRLAPD